MSPRVPHDCGDRATYTHFCRIPFSLGFYPGDFGGRPDLVVIVETTLGFEIRTTGTNPNAAVMPGLKYNGLL